MAKVRAGVIGCGFVTELHMYAYALVHLRARLSYRLSRLEMEVHPWNHHIMKGDIAIPDAREVRPRPKVREVWGALPGTGHAVGRCETSEKCHRWAQETPNMKGREWRMRSGCGVAAIPRTNDRERP